MIVKSLIGALAVLLAALVGAVWWLNQRGEDPIVEPASPFSPMPQQIQRGAYLARVGNCVACHTDRGGDPYAGGRAIQTPFGIVYASNLTPDAATGIGSWSAAHFWRAMHNGRSKDGRLLYPAFPYPNYTQVTREDSDAIFAFLLSQTPVPQRKREHALRFPYDSRWALAAWRALFFEPGEFRADPAQSVEWNRGAYIVGGLGHCNACHAPRNIFGATRGALDLDGGLIPMQNWYAPSLTSSDEAGVAHWQHSEVVDLLKHGVSARGSVMGPMAEVVFRSTQYFSEGDLAAVATFLKALPPSPPQPADEDAVADAATLARGDKVYEQHCASCHGDAGQGAEGAYPALNGNRAVTMPVPANLIRVVLSGGYPPSTAGNPQPYGMPPFAQVLNDAEIAALATFIRNAWGNQAPPVSQLDVLRYRQREGG